MTNGVPTRPRSRQVFLRRNPPRRLRACRAASRLLLLAMVMYVVALVVGFVRSPAQVSGPPVHLSRSSAHQTSLPPTPGP
ncbi:MAG: hypothetical protein ACR2J0_03945 [Mycobacteriales bacterium]